MSDLEDLADEVRALGIRGNSAQQLVAAIMSEVDRLGTALGSVPHLRHLGGLTEALDALSTARRKTMQAAAQLQTLQAGANAFADSLVAGAGRGAIDAGVATALGGAALAGAGVAAGTAANEGASPESSNRAMPARTTRTLADIEGALATFNPHYPGPFDPSNEYEGNCGSVAANVFDYLNGAPARQAETGTLSDPEMDARTGLTTTVVGSPDDIITLLHEAGPGSHAVVGILRTTGAGHWFNVFYDGTDVYTIDGQPRGGIVAGFPPSYETDVYSWDVSLGGTST